MEAYAVDENIDGQENVQQVRLAFGTWLVCMVDYPGFEFGMGVNIDTKLSSPHSHSQAKLTVPYLFLSTRAILIQSYGHIHLLLLRQHATPSILEYTNFNISSNLPLANTFSPHRRA